MNDYINNLKSIIYIRKQHINNKNRRKIEEITKMKSEQNINQT